MYAVSLRAQIKDGRIDELKEFIKNDIKDLTKITNIYQHKRLPEYAT